MTAPPSRAVKLFGTEAPPAETRLLSAGPLTAELDAGNLRYIRFGGQEAIRAISYVVRDQYWGTFDPQIEGFEVQGSGDSFVVTYLAVCTDGAQSFRYRARITGTADGSLSFEADGTPDTDFLTNRTGFVVLHPVAGVSGEPVKVTEVGGKVIDTVFPAEIDPKQPIMDIRALTHQVAPGLRVTCTMNGDTFEMEDQRNWTDASYKTYVRPLGLPFPYTLPAGESLTQSVSLAFEGSAPAVTTGAAGEAVTVSLGGSQGRVPRFGMAVEARHATAALDKLDSLTPLVPRFLSLYLDARRDDAAEALRAFKGLAEGLGTEPALEVVIPGEGPPEEELATVASWAEAAGLAPASVAVTPAGDLGFVMPGSIFPDTKEFDDLFSAARKAFPNARIGGGNFVYFTELNRKPPPVAALDFVCHGTCAIVHAADDRSVTETLEALPYVIASGRALFGDKTYRIGPGSIGSRTSPFGNEPPENPAAARMTMTRADPRQRGLLGAAWHLGYAARMAEGGIDEVILGAPLGEFGLVHHEMPYRQPWYDDAGGLYPAFHVMRGVYAVSGAERLATQVSAPRDLQALAIQTGGRAQLWLANLGDETRRVEIEGADLEAAAVSVLDETSFEACATDPQGFDRSRRKASGSGLDLGPYAVARIQAAE